MRTYSVTKGAVAGEKFLYTLLTSKKIIYTMK